MPSYLHLGCTVIYSAFLPHYVLLSGRPLYLTRTEHLLDLLDCMTRHGTARRHGTANDDGCVQSLAGEHRVYPPPNRVSTQSCPRYCQMQQRIWDDSSLASATGRSSEVRAIPTVTFHVSWNFEHAAPGSCTSHARTHCNNPKPAYGTTTERLFSEVFNVTTHSNNQISAATPTPGGGSLSIRSTVRMCVCIVCAHTHSYMGGGSEIGGLAERARIWI
jgi:hypothetical protein